MMYFESKDATEDDFFAEWFSEGIFFDGCFEIYPKKTQDQSPVRIEFWDCCVVNYQETFSSGASPMTVTLRLSPGITRNRGLLQKKPWKFTDLSTDGEYAQDVPVEEEVRILDVYFEDEKGERVKKVKKDRKINLIVQTQGMVGERIKIDLSDDDVDYEYEGEYVEDDLLQDIEVTGDNMILKLKTIKQQD